MGLVTLDPSTLQYFRRLEAINPWTHHSVHPDEVSGLIEVVPPDNRIRLTHLKTGYRDQSDIPTGAISFHTHNVPPGDLYHNNLSTDVPSWQDFRSVALATLSQGLHDHLVFTPNYTYVLSVTPGLLSNLQEQAHLGHNALVAFATSKTHGKYTALVNRVGVNYGAAFIQDWIDTMRQVGFVVEQRRQDEAVTIDTTGLLPPVQGTSTPLQPDTSTAQAAAIVVVIVLLMGLVLYVLWRPG